MKNVVPWILGGLSALAGAFYLGHRRGYHVAQVERVEEIMNLKVLTTRLRKIEKEMTQ